MPCSPVQAARHGQAGRRLALLTLWNSITGELIWLMRSGGMGRACTASLVSAEDRYSLSSAPCWSKRGRGALVRASCLHAPPCTQPISLPMGHHGPLRTTRTSRQWPFLACSPKFTHQAHAKCPFMNVLRRRRPILGGDQRGSGAPSLWPACLLFNNWHAESVTINATYQIKLQLDADWAIAESPQVEQVHSRARI